MKECNRCFRSLEYSDFSKNKHTTSGYLNQCKKCVYQKVLKRKEENPNIFKEYRKKYYWKNRQEGIRKAVEWGRKNKVKRDIIKNRWRAKNKDHTNHLTKRYQARRDGAEGQHSFQEWKNLCQKFQNRCVFCKEIKPLTKDHIIPLLHGGTDYIWNIQPLCTSCNSKKGAKLNFQYEL